MSKDAKFGINGEKKFTSSVLLSPWRLERCGVKQSWSGSEGMLLMAVPASSAQPSPPVAARPLTLPKILAPRRLVDVSLSFAYRPLSSPTIATTRHDRHNGDVGSPVCDGHSSRRKCELAVAPRHASSTPITLLITRWNTSSSILFEKSLVEISSSVTLHLLHQCLPSRVPTIGVAAMRREAPA
jgi:hypothetical protein